MKIQDIRKKVRKNDAFSTLALLNSALRLFGLNCVHRNGTKLVYTSPIWKFALYIIVFFAANAYSVYFKFQNHETYKKFTFIDSIQLVYLLGYIQYISDMIMVYKYGRQPYVDYFNLYDYIDSILGTPHYKDAKNCIRNICLFYTSIGLTTTLIELCTWSIHFNWTVVNIYSVELIYLAIRMISTLDIIANCVQVKFRLETMGDILEYYYYHADNFPGGVKDVRYDKAWTSQDVRNVNLNDPLKTVSSTHQDIITQLSRCYCLLVEQSDFINLKYGIRILLACSLYLLDIILLLNAIIRIFMGTVVIFGAPGSLVALTSFMRLIAYTVTLSCGIYYCEEMNRQAERIIRLIDHLLISKKFSNEKRVLLTELKNLIASRPIVIHARNFFKINYSTLVSMLSVIVTYTIILLQSLQ